MRPPPLPVDELLPPLLAHLRTGTSAVLTAPTGSGKTTRVPPALLDAGFGTVLVLEPRRVAARAAAARMAAERGVRLGDEVGYSVRFDSRRSGATRLEVLTTGLFLRRLQDDPFLSGVGAVVFDEFHERSLDVDVAFAMLRRVREASRPDLRVVVMSATLDAQRVSRALAAPPRDASADVPSAPADAARAVADVGARTGAPVFVGEGRLFPVDVHHLPAARDVRPADAVVAGVRAVLPLSPGDVLVFLPGLGEIRAAERALADVARAADLDLVPLHGDLPLEQQERALARGLRRRVVLATNVAETSVTVDGVTAVVDTGRARVLRHDPALGLNRLQLVPISRQSAEQRAGRAGRQAPGVCVRLWSAAEQRGLAESLEPEIRRLDLSAAVLLLLEWGEGDPRALPWLEPPPEASLAVAFALLAELGAVADGRITPLGRRLARLPVPPRLGRLLLAGQERGVTREAALAAALLAERDPFGRAPRDGPEHRSVSDVLDRVAALSAFAAGRRDDARAAGRLDVAAARAVIASADQLVAALRDAPRADARAARASPAGAPTRASSDLDALRPADEALLRAVTAAFADRLGRRRAKGDDRLLLVGGRGARMSGSAVRDPELVVCVALDATDAADARVALASGVRREWLDPRELRETVDVAFDAARQAVSARRRVRFRDLVLDETPAEVPDSEATASVLAAAAAADLSTALALDDPALDGLLARLACLAEWMPELGLPPFTRDALAALLPVLCRGRRSFADLRRAPLVDTILAQLDPRQRRALDVHAPERIEVPSGSRIALRYERGRPPVLAVRIQELFGLSDTPRIAGGRVAVLLHLLSPGMRPQQVTEDLGGFWDRTYPLVRKELAARYPRHAWPTDPRAAPPERRPRRRK